MLGFPLFTRSNEKTESNVWIRFGMRLGVSAALHPFDYSKSLMQMGYEPIPPQQGTSYLGKPILMLPNIFQYAGHIKKIDGLYGCYRGLAPKLAGSLLSMVVSERLTQELGLNPSDNITGDVDLTEEQVYVKFKASLKRDLVLTVSAIVVAHPFHVVSLRMMAQFVGRERLYTSIVDSIAEIWKTEGVLGFFAGLVPKLLCEVVCLVLSNSTVYVLNKYLIKDKVARQHNAGFTQFAYSSLLYSLQVVSTCSSVSGSRLKAGQPPFMPVYSNWVDCWKDLQCRGELNRGSSLFWRSQAIQSSSSNFISLSKLARYQ